MKIYYLDNSGFCIFLKNTTLIFDYYNDKPLKKKRSINNGVLTEKEILKNKNTYVFSSHKHYDHYNDCVLDWIKINENIKYIFDKDIHVNKRKHNDNINYLKEGETFKDDNIEVKAYGSTDIGISFMVKAEGYTIYHAGDLNFWHWEEEAGKNFIERAKNDFLSKLDDIDKDNLNIDIMIFPVDYRMGDNGDVGAKIVIERYKPKIFIPMHFRLDTEKIKSFKRKNEKIDIKIWGIKHRGDKLHFI